MRGARANGELGQTGAGTGCRRGGGVGLTTELGRQSVGDVDAVRGVGGGGPVELDVVADALGGEVGDDFGQVQGRRTRRTGAGAADGQGQKEGGAEGSPGVPTVGFGFELHC